MPFTLFGISDCGQNCVESARVSNLSLKEEKVEYFYNIIFM